MDGLRTVAAADWNALHDGSNPFVSFEFLEGLERFGCVGQDTGWLPQYFLLHDSRGLVGAAPAWLKSHSYGEFVFDFAWAKAYERVGLNYYPKLVIGIPFSPVTGPRLLVRADADPIATRALLLDSIATYLAGADLSSAHLLFATEQDLQAANTAGWLLREDCQFHWRNRGYRNFAEYVGGFSAVYRKKTLRDRRHVTESGVRCVTRHGDELTNTELTRVHALIAQTFNARGNAPYVTRDFLTAMAQRLGRRMHTELALLDGEIVGVAVFFRGTDTLYGRYWGSDRFINSLHFELCYYRGIEYCIAAGIAHFDPGVQGEHKIKRGFGAQITRSAHLIREPRFRAAIADFLDRERSAVRTYARDVDSHLPFRAVPFEPDA